MLAIITAFRSRHLAKDWEYHIWLLQRALDSMLAQTNDAFVVAVVCHEIPTMSQSKHPKIRFLPVDFPPPQRNNDDMCVDKVLKLSVGAEWAISERCDYVMFTDADDLVSRRISEFVAVHSGANGWFTPFEFVHTYSSRWLVKHFQPPIMSGPVVIVKSDLLKFASVPFTDTWLELIIEAGEKKYADLLAGRRRKINTLAAVGHTHFQRLMKAEGYPLEPLPFPGYVVINHADSTSQVAGGLGSAAPENAVARYTLRSRVNHVKRIGLSLPSLAPLTHAVRREFTIPAPDIIPKPYKSRGSLFARI
jgi:hypothetical protein